MCTPRRARQASTGPSSGPASTSTACPGEPVASTSASPCPTSHATTDHPAGGQPGVTTRVGTRTSSRPTSTATSNARSRRDRTSTASTTVTATSSSAPAHPDGHGTTPPWTAAARSATSTSQPTSGPASHAHTSAAAGLTTDSTAARTPRTVAGGTTGAARRLASNETRLTVPLSPAINGAVAIPAAAGMTSASATPGGTPRSRSRRAHPGAIRTRAAVAAADSANPGSTASRGTHSSSPTTVTASAGTADLLRPMASASRTTPPMTAARSTLGDGRARTTNPTSASPAPAAHTRGPARSSRSRNSTAPATTARFAPDTAVRWVSPAARKSSATSGVWSRVSPTVSPGSSPAERSGNTPDAVRRPSRRVPAARCHHGGAVISTGAPRTRSTATVRSLREGGASSPSARTDWPGSSPDQPSAGAIRSTRPPVVQRPAPAAASIRSAAIVSWPPAAIGRPVAGRTGRGSSVSVTRTVAEAPVDAASASGCPATIATLVPTTTAAAAAHPSAAAAPAAQPRPRARRASTTPPASSRPPTTATPVTPASSPARVTAQTASAAGTSRRSGGAAVWSSALSLTADVMPPPPVHAAGRTCARRCRRSRGAGRRG